MSQPCCCVTTTRETRHSRGCDYLPSLLFLLPIPSEVRLVVEFDAQKKPRLDLGHVVHDELVVNQFRLDPVLLPDFAAGHDDAVIQCDGALCRAEESVRERKRHNTKAGATQSAR